MALDSLTLRLLKGFNEEAREIHEGLTRDLLALESASGGAAAKEHYDHLGRGLHTLKGTAGSLGLEDLATLAHKMEDVVAPLRAQLAPIPPATADLVLRGLDAFVAAVEAYGDGAEGAPEVEALSFQLAAAASLRRSAPPPPPPPVNTSLAPSALSSVMPAATPATSADDDAEQDADKRKEGAAGGWRVQVEQVVALMRDIDRLREVRIRLDERRREVGRALTGLARLPRQEIVEVRTVLETLDRSLRADIDEAADVQQELEEGVKAIFTQPVRTVLEPLHRIVRDTCRATGKLARLSTVGGEISLDRRVLEAVKTALVHMVRNAIDHGIEPPGVREVCGKHSEGALTIRVEQQGNMVFIELADDGDGLDVRRIREVAVARGIGSAEELDQMDHRQVHQLIFHAGFSTAVTVSETSGRGVGMDLVKETIEALDGHVEVASIPGQGSRFMLSIPIELGSSPILVVRSGEHEIGLPMFAVESVVRVTAGNILRGRSHPNLQHRDQAIPLQDLGVVLGVRVGRMPAVGQALVIVQSQGHKLALSVDEIIGDRDLVIRALPPELRGIAAYQGAATLARGELVLVLRPDWLVGQPRMETRAQTVRQALVVDDSLTARALHRAMLEAGGYVVHAVSSSARALDHLQHGTYDVIVCDVAMHPMDGITFTTLIRGKRETSQTPVVLVSAADSPGDRERGTAAGADAFLSKRDCASGRLLSEVAGAIARRRAGPADDRGSRGAA